VTQEVSVARKALTAIILAIALFAAVVIQLTVVNRLPLPARAAPDLVLLLVAAIAVATGPATGAVTGFSGGLALDIAPPAAHYAGEYALVFCLVGYAAARVVRAVWDMTGEHDPVATFTVMAVAVAAGEAGKAALGILLSNPDVTTAAVTRVLPAAILYDLLLSPLVYWLVVRVTRGRRWLARDAGARPCAAVRRPAAPPRCSGRRRPARPRSCGSPARERATEARHRLAGSQSCGYPAPARQPASERRRLALPAPPCPWRGGRTMRLNFAGSRQARTARPVARNSRQELAQVARVARRPGRQASGALTLSRLA